MTLLTTILCTILAILIVVGIVTSIIAIVNTPFSIIIRTDQEHTLEFQFGYCMEGIWDSVYWFTVTRMYLNEDGMPYNGDMIFTFWRIDKETPLHINGLPGDNYPSMLLDSNNELKDNRRYMNDLSYFDDYL